MKKFFKLLVVLLVLAGLIGLAWWLTRPKPIKVVVVDVETGLVEETVANTRAGTVKACRRAKLSPSIGGQIATLDIKEGDVVKAGQLLLALWNHDLQAEIQLARSEIQTADARREAACLHADVAQREADRLVRLRRTGAVSEETVDKTVTEAKARRAECRAAAASIEVSRARLGVVEANLQRTRLVAPFDGVIAEINGELNEYVTPSPPGIATRPAVDLVDNTCFYVTAPIDEVDMPRVQVGLPARVSLDAFGDRRFEGRVRRIADYVLDMEKQARTVDVEVEFVNSADLDQLLAGYSADAEIILDAGEGVLRVPTEAVLEEKRVYVFVPADGLVEEREITVGRSNWDNTEITSGLKAGEKVVTSVDRAGLEDGALAVEDQDVK